MSARSATRQVSQVVAERGQLGSTLLDALGEDAFFELPEELLKAIFITVIAEDRLTELLLAVEGEHAA